MADSNYRVENRQREVSEPGSNKENLEDLNQQLQQLIEQIKPLPPKSKKRRKLINDLIGTIQPELIKKSLWVVSVTKENELFVEDALLLTYINIQKYLTKYKPEKGKVMNWVIGIYKNEFYKLLKKNKQAGLTKIPGGGGKKIVNVAILLLVKCDLHRLGLLLGQNYSPSKDKKVLNLLA
ncbi:MAG: hypothetical protein HC917_26335 [Richelia sp. SM2_1_7]|nr:hypothetical protein [Richelia sp. SM2_1_7]